MKISLSPELPSQTERLASQQGRKQESLVQEAVERFVDYDEWFVKRVEKGLAQIDRGEIQEHQEVVARAEALISQKQRRV
jgi:predicted transcriptional regulator